MNTSVSTGLARWRLWLVVAGVLLYACLLQGVRPLYSPDEGRYTDVALVMLHSGDWLHPMVNHDVAHWSKPPLTYWAIAASIAVFGQHEFAARLPGALAFAFTILLMLRLGRRFVPAQPWLPALVYASFAFPSLASNLVTTDTLLALWEVLQVVAFVELWWAATPAARRRAGWLLGVAAGLAFMTKGPPGLLALAACLLFAATSEGWHGLRRAFGWRALLAFVVVGLSWYAIVVAQDPAVLRYFLVQEVVERIASSKTGRNAQWYGAFRVYAPTLLIGTLPWLPVLGLAAWRHRRDALAHVRADADARLLACWFLLPLAVFMLARSRLPLYAIPLFAPLALVAARQLAPLATSPRWRLGLIAAWCVGLVVLRAVPAWLDMEDDDRQLAQAISAQIDPPPDVVAFVAAGPRYGLRFYLGSQIEQLTLHGDEPLPYSSFMASELHEDRGCRLLLARPLRRADLERELVSYGMRWRPLDDVRGYTALALLSSRCAWRKPPEQTDQ